MPKYILATSKQRPKYDDVIISPHLMFIFMILGNEMSVES